MTWSRIRGRSAVAPDQEKLIPQWTGRLTTIFLPRTAGVCLALVASHKLAMRGLLCCCRSTDDVEVDSEKSQDHATAYESRGRLVSPSRFVLDVLKA